MWQSCSQETATVLQRNVKALGAMWVLNETLGILMKDISHPQDSCMILQILTSHECGPWGMQDILTSHEFGPWGMQDILTSSGCGPWGMQDILTSYECGPWGMQDILTSNYDIWWKFWHNIFKTAKDCDVWPEYVPEHCVYESVSEISIWSINTRKRLVKVFPAICHLLFYHIHATT